MSMYIGKRIKELRESKNMKLSELAKKSGVQIATLSRIENLKMTGTLESHISIAKALGVELPDIYRNILMQETIPEKSEVSSPTVESFTYNDKASYEILTNNVFSKKMMPIVLRIEETGKTNTEQNHTGTEKFIFVLEGKINIHIGNETYTLTENKTLYFDASLKHHYTNIGHGVAKIISVVTPVAL